MLGYPSTYLVASLSLVCALGAAACKTQVIGGGDGAGGDGTGGAAGGGGAATTPPSVGGGGTGGFVVESPVAIAEWSSDQPYPWPDPDTLLVKITNYAPVCHGDLPTECAPELLWQYTIGIPPAAQVPGTYSLGDPGFSSSFFETAPNGDGTCMQGGGGGFSDGTIEVVSNDGSTIVITVSGAYSGIDLSADGTHAASICSAP